MSDKDSTARGHSFQNWVCVDPRNGRKGFTSPAPTDCRSTEIHCRLVLRRPTNRFATIGTHPGTVAVHYAPPDRLDYMNHYTVLMPPSARWAASTVWLANFRLKSAATRTYSAAWRW